MILIISWPVVLLLVGIWVVFSAICAVLYGIQNSWDSEKVKWLRPFTVKQKWGLFGLLLVIFGGAVAFGCGLAYKEPIAGVFGFFGTIVASVIAAYICSPLKWGWESGVTILGVIASLASLALVVAFAWIFVLIAIFRKSTWRLYVGIVVGLGLVLAGIACGLAIYEYQETKGLYQAADNYIADGDYEAAIELYQSMGEEERALQTRYDGAVWNMEQGNFHEAKTMFAALSEEHQYLDSAELIKKTNYLWAKATEAERNYAAAANLYEMVLDYEDGREGYQRCCYMEASQIAGKNQSTWDTYVEWFQKAGDYKDAKELALYYQALIIANEDLMAAEELLRQLPREFNDVDVMLTAIETYQGWGGSYTITKTTGKDWVDYTQAKLVLVYKQHWPKEATLEWKVELTSGKRSNSQYSEGVMPKNSVLKFTDGVEGSFLYRFEVTKQKIKLVYESISKYGSDKTTYEFAKAK